MSSKMRIMSETVDGIGVREKVGPPGIEPGTYRL